jgi:periplasmic divalent cation tolerance protein
MFDLTPILISVATNSLKNAQEISHQLLQKKLCACTHILHSLSSYSWNQQIFEFEDEFVLEIKTIHLFFPQIEKLILQTHPYELPGISFIKIDGGSKTYLDWISNIQKLHHSC